MRSIFGLLATVLACAATHAIAVETNSPAPPKDLLEKARLDVSRSWSDRGGRIISQQKRPDGTKVPHGVQLSVGPNNWLKEFSVYNDGILEQLAQFYPNGREFRFQRREHNGDGYEVIYTAGKPLRFKEKPGPQHDIDLTGFQPQTQLCQGMVKAGKRYDGQFLVRVIDGYAWELMLEQYKKGTLVKSTPFPIEKLGLPEDNTDADTWLWEFPDWPKPGE